MEWNGKECKIPYASFYCSKHSKLKSDISIVINQLTEKVWQRLYKTETEVLVKITTVYM